MKNLPNCLNNFKLNLGINNLGANSKNIKLFPEVFKSLPNNLHNLYLDLMDNNMAESVENFSLLAEAIK